LDSKRAAAGGDAFSGLLGTSLDDALAPGGDPAERAVALFRATAESVPAYREWLDGQGFDPARVSPTALVPGRILSNHVVRTREIAPGVRRVLAYSYVNAPFTVTNSGVAAILPFAVSPAEHVTSGPIMPLNAILAQENGTTVTPLTLNAGQILIQPVNQLPNGHVQFFLPTTPGQQYVIEATVDLSSWVDISTNTAAGTFLDLVDIDAAAYRYRFYRWRLLSP